MERKKWWKYWCTKGGHWISTSVFLGCASIKAVNLKGEFGCMILGKEAVRIKDSDEGYTDG